jgi:EmrB/QacA subfamily drug resistance transporter
MENKENNKVIALLFVGVLMGALDISIVGPAIPSIEKSLVIDERFAGWIFSIYVLFNLIGISLFARLSDIFGRRKIYMTALAIFAAGSLLVSFTTNFDMLLIGRAIQGFGASGIFPVASAIVGDLFPVEKRGRILGLIGAVFGIAFLIGPFIAGVMLHFFPWNSLFLINLPISAVLIYYSYKILPDTTVTGVNKIDWGGIITLGLALASFTFALNKIDVNNLTFSEPWVNGSFILFLLSSALFFWLESNTKNPIIKFSFFSNKQIVIAGIIAFVTGLVQACFVFIPRYSVGSFHVTPSAASFMLVPFVLATAVGAPVFGRMIDKFGVRIILIIGLILTAAGYYLLGISANSTTFYYISGIIMGLGLSVLSGSSLRYIMLNNTNIEDRAISQGMLTIFISVGQLIGTAAIGLMLATYSESMAYKYSFLGAAFLLSILLIPALGIKKSVIPAK